MRRTKQRMVNAIAISAVTAVSMGCSSDSVLNLDTAVSDSREQARIVEGDALDQLTIGDLVVGFQQFASSISEDGIINAPFLTTEQQLEIEALQESLNVGEISQEEFGDAVREIIGDLFPGRAFVGFGAWGGPFGIRPRGDVPIDLELTDEQKEQAQLIFEQLRDVILTRRDEMRQASFPDRLCSRDKLTENKSETLFNGLQPPGCLPAKDQKPTVSPSRLRARRRERACLPQDDRTRPGAAYILLGPSEPGPRAPV